MFISTIKVKAILTPPYRGEYYEIFAQAIASEKHIENHKKYAEELFLKEIDPTIHFEVWSHPTVKLSFKKGIKIY